MAAQSLQNALDAIAREEFRDLADYDYISARVSFRLNLREQFYWSALQAVEKYFKAILLFNGQEVKKLKHYLVQANTRIKEDTHVPLVLGSDQLQFLSVLEELGNNRYRTNYTRILGDELPKLDQLVWTIRHYARSTQLEIDGVDKSEWYLQDLLPPSPAHTPTSDQLSDGHLEKILASNDSDLLRQELVWCNCYYGESENATSLPLDWHSSSHTPVYEREWLISGKCESGGDLLKAIEKYVQTRYLSGTRSN